MALQITADPGQPLTTPQPLAETGAWSVAGVRVLVSGVVLLLAGVALLVLSRPVDAGAGRTNLLVVLCSEQATQPVVNTGSLYQ